MLLRDAEKHFLHFLQSHKLANWKIDTQRFFDGKALSCEKPVLVVFGVR